MICCFPFTDQPEITAQPENMTSTEGENVTLSCNATGNPTPSILWTKDGYAVNFPRISLSSDNKQLKITNVSRDDSGDYWIADDSPVSVSSRISFGADNKELIITNVIRADRGQYRCVAINSLGNANSNAATQDVQCEFTT